MSAIIKVTTGNCDFILEQEYPSEEAAQMEEDKQITNATFSNVKVLHPLSERILRIVQLIL